MRRFVSLAVLLFFTVPFGASMVGCGHKTITQYCNGGDSGPVLGQAKSITLSPTFATFGESVDFGQMGSGLSATAVDCKGTAVSVKAYTYATSDMSFADVNPTTGQVCGGTWNRNTGGNIPDYTTCTAPVNPPSRNSLTPLMAYLTATADGAVSNAIPVYVHPTATSIVIGAPSSTDPASCAADPDPATNCCPITTGAVVTAPAYDGNSCISQGQSAQLTARVYRNGTTLPADNITCKVGHLQYAAQNQPVLTFDQNGVATAAQPGSTIVTASISTSGSGGAAGFFSTCPPASIALSVPGQNSTSINVNVNTAQPLIATVVDTHGVTLTGVGLTFNSTTPTTIPGGSTVTPIFPGSATITAVCQPPTCNSAPFSQVGVFGNGKPITSNGIQITAPGANASVLYIGSTQSQYLLPVDFSTGQQGALVKLPYTPNSMVISDDGTTIYLGSTTALMQVSATTNLLTAAYLSVPGTVLAVAPDNSSVVVTDPNRQTVSLVNNTGTVIAATGGTGTNARWTPDSQTVYITTTGNQLLVHSSFNGWQQTQTAYQYVDVALAVPGVGAFFATNTSITEGRSYCPSTIETPGNPPVATNVYYPIASSTANAQEDRIAATNDGNHILGATVATTPIVTLNDIAVALTQPPATNNPLDCTTATTAVAFNTTVNSHAVPGITASAITGVFPASNSSLAFVTYTGTSGKLPLYVPATGAITNVQLSSGATAPVSGAFSSDDKTFYTGTAGDNQVHLITVTGTTAADTSVISPKLPGADGNPVAPNLLVQRPKKPTS